ncbi:MAG: Rrf2 family transcriptional regulator [Bryobacterales bacterium]|nr:Rrf2 family transcriptional regulator [Bryobacterales bacterium]
MQFTSQEEYGLRCLLRLATAGDVSMTIPEIATAEGVSQAYAAKLLRALREGGLVVAERGQAGGYRLSRPPEQISAAQALAVLGGRFYEGQFCEKFTGQEDECAHTLNCSIRSLWRAVQTVVDQVLTSTSLKDLIRTEEQMDRFVDNLVVITSMAAPPAAPQG